MKPLDSLAQRPGLAVAAVLLLTAVCYLPVYWVGWYFDDYHAVLGSSMLNSPDALHHILTTFIQRGVIHLSFLWDMFWTNTLFGIESIGEYDRYPAVMFHWTNVMFHLLAVGLLYVFLTRLNRFVPLYQHPLTPVWIALLFGVSRLNSEPVIYISGRASVVMTVFYLLGLTVFLELIRYNRLTRSWKEIASGGFWVLVLLCMGFAGIASKFSFLSFPLMLGVILLCRFHHHSLGKKALYCGISIGALLLCLAAIAIYRIVGLQQSPVEYINRFPNELDGFIAVILNSGEAQTRSPWENLTTQFSLIHLYYFPRGLGLFALNFDPYLETVTMMDARFWGGVAVFSAWMGLGIYLRKTVPLFLFGAVWYWITFLPSSSVIPLLDLAAERRAYLPNIGLCISLGALVMECGFAKVRLCCPAFKPFPLLILTLFAAFQMFSTWNRAMLFTDKTELWKETAALSTKHPRPHLHLASAHWKAGDFAAAAAAYHRTLELNPQLENAAMNLGILYLVHLREFQKAEFIFQNCIRMWPDNPAHWSNLGNGYLFAREVQKAEALARTWLERFPNQYEAELLLANAYFSQQRWDEAKAIYLDLLNIKKHKTVYAKLARIESQQGDRDQAEHWQRLADQMPESSARFETGHMAQSIPIHP